MSKLTKYVARHLIPITEKPGKPGDKAKGVAPVRPQIKEIKPGERVMLDPEDDNTKFLLDNGAIVTASKDDERSPVNKAAKAAKAKTDEKPASQAGGEDAELEAARGEYEELFGKKPAANMKLDTMLDKIADKRAEAEKGLV